MAMKATSAVKMTNAASRTSSGVVGGAVIVADVVKAAPASKVDALKQQIIQLSGSKYGHDLPDSSRQTIVSKVQQLEQLQLPVKVDKSALTGTTWTTVFTTSDGTSSGKVGPFITDVVQEFPVDEPGVYYNISRLGLVSATLRGDYEVTQDDRVDLEFKSLALKIGPWKAAEKIFDAGQMRGYWQVSYCDSDFRVFYSNKQNLFILRKLDS
eukprot:gene8861-9040_t